MRCKRLDLTLLEFARAQARNIFDTIDKINS